MLENSLHTFILIAVVMLIQRLAKVSSVAVFFRYCPPLLCVFLVPIVLVAMGVLPEKSAAYGEVVGWLLPAAIVLFTVATDIELLKSLGLRPFLVVVAGGGTVLLSGVAVFAIAMLVLGPETWRQIAPLVGAWVGGYSSMIAVKEGVQCSDEAFAPVLLVASVIAYSWMALLASGARSQERLNRFLNSKAESAEEEKRHQHNAARDPQRLPLTATLVVIGILAGWVGMMVGEVIPPVGSILTGATWGFLVLITLGTAFSMIRPIQRAFHHTLPVAQFFLLLVVASYGARCPLGSLGTATDFIPVGLGILAIHTVLMLLMGRLFRLTSAELAVASQANIGGPASAPVVANAYQPGTESIGVAMGVLAGIIGLPCGLIAARIMAAIAGQ